MQTHDSYFISEFVWWECARVWNIERINSFGHFSIVRKCTWNEVFEIWTRPVCPLEFQFGHAAERRTSVSEHSDVKCRALEQKNRRMMSNKCFEFLFISIFRTLAVLHGLLTKVRHFCMHKHMAGDGDADDTNNGICVRRSSAFTWNACDSIAMATRVSYWKQRLLLCQAI